MKTRTLLATASIALLGASALPALGQEPAAAEPAAAEPAAPPAAAEPAAPPAAERFNGTWRYSRSAAAGTAIIHRAVDHTVDPMNFIIRPIAAGRLRDKNPLVQRIEIHVSGGEARIVFDGHRTYRTPLGQWRTHHFDGDAIQVQIRERGGSLVQLFRSDSGTRRNVYRMLPNGNMRLEVTVQSDSLPQDMHYQLVYHH